MLLSLNHGTKILQHSATNGNVLSQSYRIKQTKILRHFATHCDLMETRLYFHVLLLVKSKFCTEAFIIGHHPFHPLQRHQSKTRGKLATTFLQKVTTIFVQPAVHERKESLIFLAKNKETLRNENVSLQFRFVFLLAYLIIDFSSSICPLGLYHYLIFT